MAPTFLDPFYTVVNYCQKLAPFHRNERQIASHGAQNGAIVLLKLHWFLDFLGFKIQVFWEGRKNLESSAT